jgi:glucosamine--fructose-6-phosphate aminotransferase (isomerizing)
MEYRGYDSAGVALVGADGITLRRSAGKLSNLETTIENEPIDGLYGVGHTRWATHGRPTEENAHPHRDCTGRIVVVHNGIIENYLELKKELQAQGHEFKTETDTEIVAHLVERETKQDGLENAVRRALKLMRGMFAIVLVSADDPEKIVAVRNGPPIVVGLGEDEFFVASDIPAILSHTRDVVFLGDEEMAVITRSGV